MKDVAAKHEARVLFDKPFPNKCLGVFLTDYTSGGINKQAIETDSMDKTGFIFLTEAPVADFFMYFAIGY
ncbi:gp53-like domain-containing protein [Fusobacterium ulcerans]|uniref:gp53-like domain-containing protein n=1 Tax=Fusobacterium ulcerans TaxID=861 RepID=UPI003CC657AC